jgi:hypothetical protein
LEIRLKVPTARWFKIAAWVLPVVGFLNGAFACSELVALSDGRDPSTPQSIALIAATGTVALISGMWFVVTLGVGMLHGRVRCDGQSLILVDQFPINSCEFPRQAVRSIAIVTWKRRTLRIDPLMPPWRMFSIGPALALDLEVPKGRIRFFKAFEENDLRRVADEIGAMLGLPVEEHEELERPRGGVADATGTYGKLRSGLVRVGLSVGAALLLGCSWFVVQGLRSLAWPTVTGKVTHSLYEERQDKNQRTTYIAEIRYEYRVNERDYSGDDLGYGRSPSDEAVKALVLSHPTGSNISVSYDPESIGRSVVIPGVGWALWILVGAAAMPVAGVLPWWIAGPRNDLDAIVLPYRVLPQHVTRGIELIRWAPPQAVFDSLRRRAVRQVLWLSIRILLWSGIALAGFWMVARRYTPQLPAERVMLVIGLMYSMPFLLTLGLVFLERRKRSPGEYRLTSKGIVRPVTERALLRWERISRYHVEPDEETQHPILVVFSKGSAPLRMPLSGDERDEAILAEIRKRGVRET